MKPVGGGGNQPPQVATRPPKPPILKLATPMGSTGAPQELQPGRTQQGQSASGGSESSAAHSRTGSFGPLDGRGSNPTSAGSQYSALSFASQYGLGGKPHGTSDPLSAAGSIYSNASESGVDMSRQDSMHGLERAVDDLTLERVRKMDAEDLDDEGWRIASMENRIVELGGLGEGAGGAVTRCMLKGGKTVFALKVRLQQSEVSQLRIC